MKEFREGLDMIIKYGVIPLFMIMVIKLNNKMEQFEERWVNCIEDKEQLLKNKIVQKNTNTEFYIKPIMVAILPNRENPTIEIEDETVVC